MLSEKLKLAIKEAIIKLEEENLIQSKIDQICVNLRLAMEEKVDEQYKVYSTVNDMKNDLNLKSGDKVKTLGYDIKDDNGDALYEIMTYDEWWNGLPNPLKLCAYHTDRIGCNQTLYKNPVDNYGNHKLKNGLVAKIITVNNTTRVEQWGCIEGRTDNCEALIHLFGNIHTGTIIFGKDKKYELYYRKYNQAHERYEEIMGQLPWWLTAERMVGNEYAQINGCRCSGKPAIGNVKDMTLVGNNCTIRIPDNEFWKYNGLADFAIFELGGVIDGFEMYGFNLDPNGLNQKGETVYCPNGDSGNSNDPYHKFVNTRTCNHTLSYFASGLGKSAIQGTSKNVIEGNGLDYKDYCFELQGNPTTFSNVNIHHNVFLANGTIVDTSDGGGDHILVINPTVSDNVFIEDNEFYDWGRWVFAVDLGGNGERFHNYKFKRNKCIQTDKNFYIRNNQYKYYRGLGWIDFEARKCWTGLEVEDNYIEGAPGWAFNGNGKITENVKFRNNTFKFPVYPKEVEGYDIVSSNWRSIYPYAVTFYSTYMKDIIVENNKFDHGSLGFGPCHNIKMINNEFPCCISINATGDCLFEGNKGEGTRNQLFSLSSSYSGWITDPNSDWYEENPSTNLVFKNNGPGGVCGTLIKPDDIHYYNNTSLIFEGNKFRKFNLNCFGLKEYTFSIDELASNITFAARGAKTNNKSYSTTVNPVVGGLFFEEGDLISDSTISTTRFHDKSITDYFTVDSGITVNEFRNNDIYCKKAGVLPTNGEFLMCEADRDFRYNKGKDVGVGTFVYTLDNMYYVSKAGVLDAEIEPTHTEGVVDNGTASLMWFAPMAKIEIRERQQ